MSRPAAVSNTCETWFPATSLTPSSGTELCQDLCTTKSGKRASATGVETSIVGGGTHVEYRICSRTPQELVIARGSGFQSESLERQTSPSSSTQYKAWKTVEAGF